MVNAGSSSTPPGPSSEQESEIKAQEPETERPKDQGKVKRTLNAARKALVTEERAQLRTLAKLRSDKAKITAAEIQLKEEKEKSARRELEFERGIERLQAERAQLDKEFRSHSRGLRKGMNDVERLEPGCKDTLQRRHAPFQG